MLKNLNIKREYLLVIGSLLLLLVSYNLAFKKTVDEFQLHQQLKSRLSESSDLSYQPDYLERKNKNLDLILKQYQSDSLTLRGNSLAEISSIAEKDGVKLSEVPMQDASYNTPSFMVERLDFEGDYRSLLQTLRHLQATKGIGVPRSVIIMHIKKSDLSATSSAKLLMDVLFEIGK